MQQGYFQAILDLLYGVRKSLKDRRHEGLHGRPAGRIYGGGSRKYTGPRDRKQQAKRPKFTRGQWKAIHRAYYA